MMEAVEVVGLCTLSQARARGRAHERHIAGSLHNLHHLHPWLTGLCVRKAFCDGLFLVLVPRPRPRQPLPRRHLAFADDLPASWPPEWRKKWLGRVAVMVVDGLVSERDAERYAPRNVAKQMKRDSQPNSAQTNGRMAP